MIFGAMNYVILTALTVLHIRTNAMFDDYTSVYDNRLVNKTIIRKGIYF